MVKDALPLVAVAAGLLGAAGVTEAARRRVPPAAPAPPLPEDFRWGVALSGYQAEGRSPDSNWTRHESSRAPMIREPFGTGPDFAGRYAQDIALAASLGVDTFRFSLEWARTEPAPGVLSEEGWAFYDAVMDELDRHGLRAMITIDHRVYPGWVLGRGGWDWNGIVDAWLMHAERVLRRYAGRGVTWITVNKPSFYLDGERRDRRLGRAQRRTMKARLLECHQRAYAIAHEVDPGCMVSSNLACVPAPLHHLTDSWFVDRCRDTLDFVGIDYYYGLSLDNLTVWRDTIGHYRSITPQPESLRYMLRIYAKKFPGLPIWIVEHGMPTDDGRPRADGITRGQHLADHVRQIQLAIAEGIPVIGYNHWSLTDNYEWGSYRPRFGLWRVEVRDGDLTRVPTDGVEAYRRIIAGHGVPHDHQPVCPPAFGVFAAPWETTLGRLQRGARR